MGNGGIGKKGGDQGRDTLRSGGVGMDGEER